MKLRADIARRVNELAGHYSFKEWDFDLLGTYRLIFEYLRKSKDHNVSRHQLSTENGMLIIDGEAIDRVAYKRSMRNEVWERSDIIRPDYEELILKRQEEWI